MQIYAPGSNIYSVAAGDADGYTTMSGTSMACPHVSGVAALLLSEQPDLTPEQVRDTLVCYSATGLLDSWQYNYRSDDVPRYLLQVPPSGFSVFDTNDDGGAGSCSPSPVSASDDNDGCPYSLVMQDTYGDG